MTSIGRESTGATLAAPAAAVAPRPALYESSQPHGRPADIISQESRLCAVAGPAFINGILSTFKARVDRAVRLDGASRPAQAGCVRALFALDRALCRQLETGDRDAPDIDACTSDLGQALELLTSSQQRQVVGASKLYPRCTLFGTELGVLAQSLASLPGDSCDSASARQYLAKDEQMNLTGRRIPDAWELQVEAFRRAPAVVAIERTLMENSMAELASWERATVGLDPVAWASSIRRARTQVTAYRNTAELLKSQGLCILDDVCTPSVRAELYDYTCRTWRFSSAMVPQQIFLDFCWKARAAEDAAAATFVHPAHSIVVPQALCRAAADNRAALHDVTVPTRTLAMQHRALSKQNDELAALAAATAEDAGADDSLLSFVQVVASRSQHLIDLGHELNFVAEDVAELRAASANAREVLTTDAQKIGAIAPMPELAEKQVSELNTDAPGLSADAPRARDRALPSATKGARSPGPIPEHILTMPPAASSLWRHTLANLTDDERAGAALCFARGTFASAVASAAYHYHKHRARGQSMTAYMQQATKAMDVSQAWLVPSLADPGVRHFQVSNERTFCVFTRDGRIVTYRDRGAHGD